MIKTASCIATATWLTARSLDKVCRSWGVTVTQFCALLCRRSLQAADKAAAAAESKIGASGAEQVPYLSVRIFLDDPLWRPYDAPIFVTVPCNTLYAL